ncbi:putative 2-oxoglutarate dehydrogenase E1 component DHKTD1, mitochondrial [Quaeritorhiza haematococci]|nr:putative 2-oxoglutarate dehydrogenase E1 component DHKTD1, mitochondrial [Quaeritorhiza haematococci]
MPHRGRLNLLTDILRFNAAALFHKVKGNAEFPDNVPGIGDVLSHLANSVDLDYGGKKPLHVSMLHNPSHLEAVNPVAMGKARARQMYLYEEGTETDCYLGDRVMCVQLHGDAAFTGQGVVTETLGLSNLPHFTSGGSVHVIVNNQIGYTTPAMNARSTVYTSDVAKMINAPVIHVNADFPEDVANAISIAFEYRNTFRKDVILDLIAYRRWGHNELDEPAFTQPLMYKNIRTRKSVPKMYEESLIADKIITQAQADDFRTAYFNELDKKLQESYDYKPELDALKGKWSKMILPTTAVTKPETGVEIDTLKDVGRKSVQAPAGVTVHPRLAKYHIEQRLSKIESGTKLDWATAEALAFGSLLLDGYNVRISGQDVGRGTFSQRHVMLVDQETERTIIPLNRLHKPDASGAAPLAQTKKQGMLEIANSSLSEFAVMGFELGVSWETPNRLCIWEAQFGDFFNGAQIVIDTYLSSGEAKWFRQTGLVLLLPHGYDGAGPEHSSARLERFLQLCDQKFDVLNEKNPDNPNMHVVNPTTPAQYFHLLRRQMVRPFRKPLVVIGPKILLRHPQAVSDLAEMGPKTHFHPVLPDPTISAAQTKDVRRVIFVCGKLYYDLVKARQDKKLDGQVAIVRMEELAPFPTAEVVEELAKFGHVREFFWVQEEPQNQGAYTYVEPRLSQLLPNKEASATTSAPPRGYLHYVGRAPCAAPAVGVSSRHKAEHATLLKQAFEGL